MPFKDGCIYVVCFEKECRNGKQNQYNEVQPHARLKHIKQFFLSIHYQYPQRRHDADTCAILI